ncbi:UDP-glycosyltransferase UGT5-like [Xylocopa sonorina]|uniref:UDP-glycosyltransferase UGT5-like n=1 Tax=Xylocopa sonorina TaxID=1818115 RepID=UPI00403AFD05
MLKRLIICSLLLTCWNPVNCGRILIIMLSPLYSHQVPYYGLLKELLKRGHEIVGVTAIPLNDTSIANLTEIDISVTHELFNRIDITSILMNYQTFTTYEKCGNVYQFTNVVGEIFYNHPEIKKLYATGSDAKFDLIIMESIVGFTTYALPYRLKAPLIGTNIAAQHIKLNSTGIQTTDLHMYHNYLLGLPIMTSHPSNWELVDHAGPNLSFWDKVWNFIVQQIMILQLLYYIRVQQQLVERWVGSNVPSLYDIAKNTSLFMIEYDPLIGHPKPLSPNVIFFTGLHIQEKPPPLPTEVSEFLGNATNGFVYMNLGCTIKSSFLPFDTLRAIYNVFSRLPYKVLWKYEMDDLPKRNGNILISDWLPQQSILAHPNIKLFIFQGGQQSTEEAIYYSVPIVGIPFAFEQPYHIRRLQSLGAGRGLLNHKDIDEEIFYEAIHDVLSNESYKTNMAELTRLLKDKPYDNKKHMVWWIEYVMRNKGASHLRFTGSDEPWYSRSDMDVIAFLSIVLFVLTVIWVIALAMGIRWLYRHQCLLSRVIKKVSPARSALKRD